MSPAKRSALMAKIRSRNTGIEKSMAAEFRAIGLKWDSHARDLPGCPDFIFRRAKVAVFVDGDFWHGWRFPVWRKKLSKKWEQKIDKNRARDASNRRRLQRLGWRVIRLWEHQIESSPAFCVDKVAKALRGAWQGAGLPGTFRLGKRAALLAPERENNEGS